jgi:NO-binding membrane sensor protein with MHYT domain
MRLAVDVLGAFSGLIPLAAASSEPTAPFTHDQVLAAVSMAAAVAGCYAALELGARAQARTGLAGAIWLAAAGLLLGAGVWAMHFVALVALETPLLRGFEVGPTVASCVIALVFGASGFVLGGRHWRSWRYGVAGVWFGVGSILMHYVGMQGLVIDADLSYRALFVAGTGIGAFICSTLGLWLCTSPHPGWVRFGVAFPMGAAIVSLHFFDIAGTVLAPRPTFAPPPASDAALGYLTALVAGLAALVAVSLAWWDARRGLAFSLRFRRTAGASAPASAASPDPEEGVVVIPDPPGTASGR